MRMFTPSTSRKCNETAQRRSAQRTCLRAERPKQGAAGCLRNGYAPQALMFSMLHRRHGCSHALPAPLQSAPMFPPAATILLATCSVLLVTTNTCIRLRASNGSCKRQKCVQCSRGAGAASRLLAPPVGRNVLALVRVVLPARQQRRRTLGATVHARRLRGGRGAAR